jgi:hypothetical protein
MGRDRVVMQETAIFMNQYDIRNSFNYNNFNKNYLNIWCDD